MTPIRSSLLVPLVAALALSGCYAERVSFRPNPEQRALLREPPLPYVVPVVPWSNANPYRNATAWTDGIAKQLERSGAFATVHYVQGSRTPVAGAQLYAEATTRYCNTAIIPIFTILTLGLVPTIWNETQCSGAIFRRADGSRPQDSVVVEVQQTGKAVMGWVAAPLGLLPGFSYGGKRGQSGYLDAFRLAIIGKKDELAALAAPAP